MNRPRLSQRLHRDAESWRRPPPTALRRRVLGAVDSLALEPSRPRRPRNLHPRLLQRSLAAACLVAISLWVAQSGPFSAPPAPAEPPRGERGLPALGLDDVLQIDPSALTDAVDEPLLREWNLLTRDALLSLQFVADQITVPLRKLRAAREADARR